MFHGIMKDSAVVYAGTKAVKKSRRKSKDVEFFTPEFKAQIKEAFDSWVERNKVAK